jgi:AraC-like DNA-binding protein
MVMLVSKIAGDLLHDRHLILSSDDLDEIKDGCTRMLRPHELMLRTGRGHLATQLHGIRQGPLSINRLCYGGDVSVRPAGPDGDDFLITLPLQGNADFTYGSENTGLSSERGAIIGPYHPFQFDIGASFDQVVVRLSRHRVESVCTSMLGLGRSEAVHFNLALNTLPTFWFGLVETVVGLSTFGDARSYPILFTQLEELLIETLLLTQPSNFSVAIAGQPQTAPSRQTKRAAEYMRERLTEPIRQTDVAQHCGLSLRGLQLGFQRDFGVSPGKWLRLQRLDKVYEILSCAAPGTVSVTDIAFQWGFSHLGEFSAQFKARYGKRPSEVLAKRT